MTAPEVCEVCGFPTDEPAGCPGAGHWATATGVHARTPEGHAEYERAEVIARARRLAQGIHRETRAVGASASMALWSLLDGAEVELLQLCALLDAAPFQHDLLALVEQEPEPEVSMEQRMVELERAVEAARAGRPRRWRR